MTYPVHLPVQFSVNLAPVNQLILPPLIVLGADAVQCLEGHETGVASDLHRAQSRTSGWAPLILDSPQVEEKNSDLDNQITFDEGIQEVKETQPGGQGPAC